MVVRYTADKKEGETDAAKGKSTEYAMCSGKCKETCKKNTGFFLFVKCKLKEPVHIMKVQSDFQQIHIPLNIQR